MGTRSNIGIMNKDGSVDVVYCHWDGYPEGVGACLVKCYNNEEDARKIIALGDLSSLRERLEPNENEKHSFENPVDGVSIFYGRDRGEDCVDARHYENIEEWVKYLCTGGWDIEFAYLFTKEGKWRCYSDWANNKFKKEISLYEEPIENVRILIPSISNEELESLEEFLDSMDIEYDYI